MSFAGVLLILAAAGPGTQDPAARTLLRLEDGWATALVRRDTAFFGRILALGFTYSENERTISRAALLRDLAGGSDTVTSAHNEDMEVHGFGGTAVVTGWLVVRGHRAAAPFEHRYRFTDTWMRRAGRWQIVAAHDYLAPT
jgi:hypothetical protein